MKRYHLFVGVPRTGSTLLATILNQHPEVYVASSTAMLEVICAAQKAWKDAPTMIAHPNPIQYRNMSVGLAESMWKHRSESIIIDRNREWANNLTMATEVFGDPKIIITTRDLPSIMASWKRLYLQEWEERLADVQVETMWKMFVKDTADKVRRLKQEVPDNYIIVTYNNLIEDTKGQLKRIESFLKIPTYEYDLNNIQGEYQEKNIVLYGPEGLHRVKPTIEKQNTSPKDILGEALYEKYKELEKDYLDIFSP